MSQTGSRFGNLFSRNPFTKSGGASAPAPKDPNEIRPSDQANKVGPQPEPLNGVSNPNNVLIRNAELSQPPIDRAGGVGLPPVQNSQILNVQPGSQIQASGQIPNPGVQTPGNLNANLNQQVLVPGQLQAQVPGQLPGQSPAQAQALGRPLKPEGPNQLNQRLLGQSAPITPQYFFRPNMKNKPGVIYISKNFYGTFKKSEYHPELTENRIPYLEFDAVVNEINKFVSNFNFIKFFYILLTIILLVSLGFLLAGAFIVSPTGNSLDELSRLETLSRTYYLVSAFIFIIGGGVFGGAIFFCLHRYEFKVNRLLAQKNETQFFSRMVYWKLGELCGYIEINVLETEAMKRNPRMAGSVV